MNRVVEPRQSSVFYTFVCVTLTVLLLLNGYSYMRGHPIMDGLDDDFTNIRYVITQLTRGLYEVNRKHEHLHTELQRLSENLPAVTASGDRIKQTVEPSLQQVASQLSAQDYDKQIADYALESAGGRILDTGDTVEHVMLESTVTQLLYAITSYMCGGCSGARTILRPNSLPGECWAFRGSKGEATIRLLGAVHIVGVSLEHISRHISPTKDISSAPRLFQIQGLESRYDQHGHDFGMHEYSREGNPIQYFAVTNPSPNAYHLIRLKIITNWGHPVYTCVYRFRVHGELAAGQGAYNPVKENMGDSSRIDIGQKVLGN